MTQKSETFEARLFIDGEFVNASDGATFETFNPADESVLTAVSEASSDDVDSAVDACKRAQREWFALDARDRCKALLAVADAIEGRGDQLAKIDSLNAGRPIEDCIEDIHAASGMFRHFAGLSDKIVGQTIPVENEKLCYTRREPYGVVAAITAWNYPLFNACAKLAPVLATGNACILKPAEETPLSALALARIISDEVPSVPKGLISVLNGRGESTGALLTHHDGVRKVTFTGSTDVGREILRASAASNLKSVVLELGGKSPFVIFDDADVEMALNGITFSVFFNQGQTCTAGTRLVVQAGVLDAVLAGLKERIGRITVGDPSDPDTLAGPIISRAQYEKVSGFIQRGIESGAELVCGGGRPAGLDNGYFVEPTVFLDPPLDSELARDEIFGPVLVIQSFESVDDALTIANSTDYGLAASVWTKDSQRLLNFAHNVEAGIVWCNTVFNEHPGVPAGGYKQSGFGREYGHGAVDEYTRVKTVWVDLSGEYFAWA